MIYDFGNGGPSTDPIKVVDQRLDAKTSDGLKEKEINISQIPLPDAKPRDDMWFERQNVNIAEEIHDILPVGFRTMDRGIKNFFAGMQVPTKDGIKMVQTRISGGDKPYLIWAQDLKLGRITLPVMSIKRESEEFNPDLFSPAHTHYMSRRYLDSEGSRMALAYRPIPALLKYTLSTWAEHKRDLEYIKYQILTRFTPVAEYMVEDEHLRGSVLLKYEGVTNAVDDDVPPDQRANKRHDYSITMEGWLPLPEKIVPSILGRVTTLKDGLVKNTTLQVLTNVTQI